MGSSIDYAICYHAALRLGAITSGINPRLGSRETESIFQRTGSVVSVVGDGLDTPANWNGSKITMAELRSSFDLRPLESFPDLRSEDPVAIVWTSGTTGVPKGAVFNHLNLMAVARATGDLSAEGDRRLSPLPFAHVGYMTRAWDELSKGITTVISPTPWNAQGAISVLESEQVTVAQGVPTQWKLMLARDELSSVDLSSLRVAGTGGSAVSPELVRELRTRLGCSVVVGYASTETAVISKSRIGDSDEEVALTVGQAADGVEIKIVDSDLVQLPAGQIGTVMVRSEAAMVGYWGDQQGTQISPKEGWISTGDLGRLDERGFLVLSGRQTEMYIRGGYNIYPVEVEAVLCEHPGISQAAVVGVPDPVLGEIGVAFLVASPSRAGVHPDSAELRAWCSSLLADYKRPDVFEYLESLPLTAMSKVDKAKLTLRAAELVASMATKAGE